MLSLFQNVNLNRSLNADPPRQQLTPSRIEEGVWRTIVILVPSLSFLARGAIPYLLVLAAVVLFLRRPRCLIDGVSRTRPLVYVLGAFVAFAFSSRFYGVDPDRATTLAFHFLLGLFGWVMLSGSNLSSAQISRVASSGLICISIWFVVYLLDAAFEHALGAQYAQLLGQDYYFHLFNRPLTFSAFIALPLLACLDVKWRWRAAVLSLVALVLFSSQSESGMVSIVGASVGWLLTFKYGRRWLLLSACIICTWILCAPLIIDQLPVESAEFMSKVPHRNLQARVYFWHHATTFTAQSPWLGHGGEASRYFSHFPHVEHPLFRANGDVEILRMRPIGMHPHNAIVQTWLEYGAIGALLAATSVALVVSHCARSASRSVMAWRMSLFTAFFLMMNAAYGAWQTDWVAIVIFAAVLLQKVEGGNSAAAGG